MRTPMFERIRKTAYSGRTIYTGTRFVHANPRFYKYYWFLFTAESKEEGGDFFAEHNRLTHAQVEQEHQRLSEKGLEVWVYNQRLHRIGDGSPFDEASLRARGITAFAPAYEDDEDTPNQYGYK